MKTNILFQNLNSAVTQFDRDNGVELVGPCHFRSAKHGLFGYSTIRQLRNAIKRKLAVESARRVAQSSPDAVSDRD